MGEYFKEGIKSFKKAIQFQKHQDQLKRLQTMQNVLIFVALAYFLLRVIYYGY